MSVLVMSFMERTWRNSRGEGVGANSSPKCHSVLEGTSYLWISLLERRRNRTPTPKEGEGNYALL